MSGSGAVALAAVLVDVHRSPADFFLASVTELPPVPLLACAGILVGPRRSTAAIYRLDSVAAVAAWLRESG